MTSHSKSPFKNAFEKACNYYNDHDAVMPKVEKVNVNILVSVHGAGYILVISYSLRHE